MKAIAVLSWGVLIVLWHSNLNKLPRIMENESGSNTYLKSAGGV